MLMGSMNGVRQLLALWIQATSMSTRTILADPERRNDVPFHLGYIVATTDRPDAAEDFIFEVSSSLFLPCGSHNKGTDIVKVSCILFSSS